MSEKRGKEEFKYFKGALRPYQIEGVNWLLNLHHHAVNGILADEMGLGKTIQVIALICALMEDKKPGPFLIVVPLSTLPNWKSEWERFAPDIPVVCYHGYANSHVQLRKNIKMKYRVGDYQTHPVVLTPHHFILKEGDFLTTVKWKYVIVDEGHRLKNNECQFTRILNTFSASCKLLLTGTPLQNNIKELWSLLNFLMPQIFNNVDSFSTLLMLEDVKDENKFIEQEQKTKMVTTIHQILKPFVLRRLKKDVLDDLVPKKEVLVYCNMTDEQATLYESVIEKSIMLLLKKREEEDIYEPSRKRRCTQDRKYYNIMENIDESYEFDLDYNTSPYGTPRETPERSISGSDSSVLSTPSSSRSTFSNDQIKYVDKLTMTRPLSMLMKITDHPYLVRIPLDPNYKQKTMLIDEGVVRNSGKMIVLDQMLAKLKQKGHKVLIFSTLCMMLDIIEDYLIMRDYKYCRLDGTRSLSDRGENVDAFNSDPSVFVFLLSTRAGGLGLNLTAADTVIFFDRDWNPQVDIQAQDRCHRIGQTKPVMIYTLICKNTIDETVLDRGLHKRILEKLVIKDGKFMGSGVHEDKGKVTSSLMELRDVFKKSNNVKKQDMSEAEFDTLLDRSELYEMMERK
ncbi:unnamed protein product [Acanthoscelides obtectus]|nr:unnamed protein product [Acanthoscelides obtectus]CAK1670636.1 Lymphoid-specific helicase [Acanthoscelides obtectus]